MRPPEDEDKETSVEGSDGAKQKRLVRSLSMDELSTKNLELGNVPLRHGKLASPNLVKKSLSITEGLYSYSKSPLHSPGVVHKLTMEASSDRKYEVGESFSPFIGATRKSKSFQEGLIASSRREPCLHKPPSFSCRASPLSKPIHSNFGGMIETSNAMNSSKERFASRIEGKDIRTH
eukprot:jgi/Galph1/2982/GphlegSOOS_G1647.1